MGKGVDVCGLSMFLFFFGAVLFLVIKVARISDTLDRLEHRFNALFEHSGLEPTELANRKAVQLLQRGRKIEAIRIYRLFTGAGLAEAKAAVERLQESLPRTDGPLSGDGTFREGEPPRG